MPRRTVLGLTLGGLGLFSLFSLFTDAGNCTGGEGDLTMSAIYAGVCSVAGAVAVALTRRPWVAWFMAAAGLPLIYSAWIALSVLTAWMRSGQSACRTLTGLPYGPSGGETSAAPAIVAFTLVYVGLVLLAFKRKTPRA